MQLPIFHSSFKGSKGEAGGAMGKIGSSRHPGHTTASGVPVNNGAATSELTLHHPGSPPLVQDEIKSFLVKFSF